MKAAILKGKRITLRSLKLEDASVFVRWLKDKDVTRFLTWQSPVNLIDEKKWIRKQLKSEGSFTWSILNENSKLIGNCALRLKEHDRVANFGIVIGEKDEWGKGYSGEVIKIIGNYIFDKLKYQRFELSLDMDNKRALKAYEKSGFKLEGVRKRYRFNNITKKFSDDGLMGILKEEWKK